MRKILIPILTMLICLIGLLGCKHNKQKNEDSNLIDKNEASIEIVQQAVALNHIFIDQKLIEGIWAENTEEDANFKIEKDSMYFIEDWNNPLPIRISNDTLITDYDGFKTYDIILKLDSDSLVLRNEVDKVIRLYRR